MSMVHVLALITAKPGQREALLAAFQENVPNVLAEDGCIEYQATVDWTAVGETRREIGFLDRIQARDCRGYLYFQRFRGRLALARRGGCRDDPGRSCRRTDRAEVGAFVARRDYREHAGFRRCK